jgi:ABC-type branched-subunit amino acid transport system ATPase component/predicted MFS family arabinose efflux permease
MTRPVTKSRRATAGVADTRRQAKADAALDELVRTRDELRAEAREKLGVVGSANTEKFRVLVKRHGLSYYPVIALGLLYASDQLQGYAFVVLAPDISRALGIGIGAIAAARAAYALAFALAPLPIAWLAQHRTHRALICIVTGAVWSVMTLYTGFITSLLGLVLILIFDGLSTGSVTALHSPLIMDSYHPEARVRALSVYSSFYSFGQVVAPLLIAFCAGALGLTWRGVFLAMGLTSLLVTAGATGLRDPGYGRWDTERLRAAVREKHGEAGEAISETDVQLGFWEICRRMWLVPTNRRLYAGATILGILVVPYYTFLSFFLERRWGLDATHRSLFFAFYSAIGIVGLVIYGPRGERQFRSNPARFLQTAGAILASAVGFVAIGGLMPVFAGVVVAFGIAGALLGIAPVAFYMSLMSVVPAQMRAHAQALGAICIAAGSLVGTVFLAGIDRRYGIAGSMASLAIPGLIGGYVLSTAGRFVNADLDRMIDEVIEQEEVHRIVDHGGHLPMLACRGIDFSYGKLQVLYGVDFSVDDGEMVALLGVNGAGKSTLLKAISGIGLPTGGSVRYRGQDITYLDAERRLRLGITQIPRGRAVFGPMNVVENMRTFGFAVRRDGKAVDEAIERSFAAFPRLYERRSSLASTLSGGEQQMLGLSKALILRPRLLLIDELSLGLAPVIVGQLLDMVREINADGTAVVLVEQSVNIALNLADHAYFMEKGEMRFDGRSADLLARDDLLRAVFLRGAAAGAGR